MGMFDYFIIHRDFKKIPSKYTEHTYQTKSFDCILGLMYCHNDGKLFFVNNRLVDEPDGSSEFVTEEELMKDPYALIGKGRGVRQVDYHGIINIGLYKEVNDEYWDLDIDLKFTNGLFDGCTVVTDKWIKKTPPIRRTIIEHLQFIANDFDVIRQNVNRSYCEFGIMIETKDKKWIAYRECDIMNKIVIIMPTGLVVVDIGCDLSKYYVFDQSEDARDAVLAYINDLKNKNAK